MQNETQASRANGYEDLITDDRVHSSLYTDDDVFEDEMASIFRNGWVFICHESEIAGPGDFVRRNVGRDPVFAIRARDGEISVIENRCAHRGNIICQEDSGTAKALVCQYHGWAYDTKGALIDVPYPAGFKGDFACHGLERLPKVDSYRGFVFASYNADVPSLLDHLGKATALIDQAAEMSPVGRLRLSGGWITHRFNCNWKMLPENDTDGYHVNFVHPSFAQAIRSNYDEAVLQDEESLKSQAKDWGNGHTELNFSPSYTKSLEWFGCAADRYPAYTKAMTDAYGAEKGESILLDGPPHAVIFPNLFLGEMNIGRFEPVSPGVCLHIHTPMYLEGVDDDVNHRILRQSEGALGPTAFLLADDCVIAERTQGALAGEGGWLDLSRGSEREVTDESGIVVGHLTDETSNRGFWRHYKKVMLASDPQPSPAVAVA
ncbi:putative dioxygenase hydroxylase component subunit alpha [Aurantiacibacter atlanticus]|uniref:Putative dioxygenase hydroxylase component subunit alpha n=1 Tax=Aurantiacibacter atlanticus TaxID=1648404 RepID=A0A0H4V9H8_9SPHN|nr:Rieske 2Fe-2S domain-containing protein [Aurantiacibacter atlanticus]AKQ41247.1 putative dioxygenase hydroxylase component subunit alpha [Aurantiacibacter atlanticus]